MPDLKNKKIDPSDIKQQFVNLHIKIHCCRYWALSEWEFVDMAFPFWRVYYNTIEGAFVNFHGKKTALKSDCIIVIPPNTSFSTSFKNETVAKHLENVEGKRIEKEDIEQFSANSGLVDHLFIHFNLGYPYDMVLPDIYSIPINPIFSELLSSLKNKLISDTTSFPFPDSLLINTLIGLLLNSIPRNIWIVDEIDSRMKKVFKYIEKHLHENISNKQLANEANMATNSFARYFRHKTGMSLRQFIIKSRIERSCSMMHHTAYKIDEIAERCGFCDRQYFSRVFKEFTNVSPAHYRKHLMIANG